MRLSKPLLPKEHGAWAMLIVPLLLGAAIAPVWHYRTILLFVAALAFFLMRHPLATLVKFRQRKNMDRTYLWQWSIIYGGVALLGVGWLIVGYRLWWLLVLGGVGSLLVLFHLWLVARRQEMSVIGELSGIVGLALGAPMAYYTASGQLDGLAWLLWLINLLYFSGTVFYIKLKVRQQPRLPAPTQVSDRLIKAKACLTYQTLALTVSIVVVALELAPKLLPLALLPAALKSFYGAWQWQDRASLSLLRLGIIEIVHAILFAGLVIAAF